MSKFEYFIHPFNKCITKNFTFSSVVLVGFNLELHSTWNINERLILSLSAKFSHSFLGYRDDELTTASTAGDVSPTTNNAGHLDRKKISCKYSQNCAGREMFICVISKPTLVCWLCPHSGLQLASRSPGPDGWCRDTDYELVEIGQCDLATM